MKKGFLVFVTFCYVIVIFCCAACIHDLRVMKFYNNKLQERMDQIANDQAEQSKEMRVMRTNNEIIYDLVINKEWEK